MKARLIRCHDASTGRQKLFDDVERWKVNIVQAITQPTEKRIIIPRVHDALSILFVDPEFIEVSKHFLSCLLYTSDAADEE